MNASLPPRVLMVDDNPGDVFLFEECLRESAQEVVLVVAGEVDEGISLLEAGPPPCLALIDLHLPRRDGRHLLTWLRDHSRLSGMPAVVLSSSQRQQDSAACLGLGACEVLTKPTDWAGFGRLVGALAHYWQRPAALGG